MKLNKIYQIIRAMKDLPEIELSIFGSKHAESMYRYFTKQHPRYKIIQNKKWGCALMPIPDSFNDFLRGRPKQVLRTNRNHCLNMGYSFGRFEPKSHIDEIMDINTSVNCRQNKPMASGYLDKSKVLGWIEEKPYLFGVFDNKNVLKAYANVPVIGDVCILSRLLGHDQSLNDGVMYLLISEVIRDMILQKLVIGYPNWIMYDTFFGASDGLKYFKERLGFKPYKVNWRLG